MSINRELLHHLARPSFRPVPACAVQVGRKSGRKIRSVARQNRGVPGPSPLPTRFGAAAAPCSWAAARNSPPRPTLARRVRSISGPSGLASRRPGPHVNRPLPRGPKSRTKRAPAPRPYRFAALASATAGANPMAPAISTNSTTITGTADLLSWLLHHSGNRRPRIKAQRVPEIRSARSRSCCGPFSTLEINPWVSHKSFATSLCLKPARWRRSISSFRSFSVLR